MSSVVAKSSAPVEGITRVALRELIALRGDAGKPERGRLRARAMLTGGHASPLRGRGMDYAESRIYQPGDDVRTIDWRRTARSGKWHTKLYETERERSVLLLLDTHASMRFGTRVRYKSVAAARAAAWLAWTAARGGDRVGALAFGSVRAAIDPAGGTRGVLGVLGAITRWDGLAADGAAPEAGEALPLALARAQRLLTPGSRGWLLSDGWCADAGSAAALARIARNVELRVVIVVDAMEREPPAMGACTFATRFDRGVIDLARAGPRACFRERMARGQQTLAAACAEAGVAWTVLATHENPRPVLASIERRGAVCR